MNNVLPQAVSYETLSEPALLEQLRAGDAAAYRHVMSCNNQRLFRTARAFVGSDPEAEDVVQEAYVRAFEHLPGFRGEAALSTWLVSIVVNESRQRLRNRKLQTGVDAIDREPRSADVISFPGSEDPAAMAARTELRYLLEQAIGELPPNFRAVFLLREVEECSIDETAEILDIKPETVKTRLHRARRCLRGALEQRVAASLKDAFHFQGARCLRITERVMRCARMRVVLERSRPRSEAG